jgi:hypothetical protein
MARARRFLLWYDALRIPSWSPVAVFRIPETGSKVPQKGAGHGVPGPNHRFQHLERCFMLHYIRISACLALASAGGSSR